MIVELAAIFKAGFSRPSFPQVGQRADIPSSGRRDYFLFFDHIFSSIFILAIMV